MLLPVKVSVALPDLTQAANAADRTAIAQVVGQAVGKRALIQVRIAGKRVAAGKSECPTAGLDQGCRAAVVSDHAADGEVRRKDIDRQFAAGGALSDPPTMLPEAPPVLAISPPEWSVSDPVPVIVTPFALLVRFNELIVAAVGKVWATVGSAFAAVPADARLPLA